jgi:hypothetical protein
LSLDFSLYSGYSEVFSINITHNLNTMADKAGIYYALWRPDERKWYQRKYKKGKDIIPILQKGLTQLIAQPTYFQQFDPLNKWGDYYGLVAFVQNVLKACKEYPNARIVVSR